MKVIAKRRVILDMAAKAVLKDRKREHGAPENTFETHAQLFSVFLSMKTGHAINLNPEDVAMLMVLFKVGRVMANPKNGDSWADIAGYAACGSELAAALVDDEPEGPPVGSIHNPIKHGASMQGMAGSLGAAAYAAAMEKVAAENRPLPTLEETALWFGDNDATNAQ